VFVIKCVCLQFPPDSIRHKKELLFFLAFLLLVFVLFFHQGEREKISPVLSINLTIQRNAMRTIYPEGNMSKQLVLVLSHQFTLFFLFISCILTKCFSHTIYFFVGGFFNFSLYIYVSSAAASIEERTKSISINCCSHILDCVNCEFSQVKLVD